MPGERGANRNSRGDRIAVTPAPAFLDNEHPIAVGDRPEPARKVGRRRRRDAALARRAVASTVTDLAAAPNELDTLRRSGRCGDRRGRLHSQASQNVPMGGAVGTCVAGRAEVSRRGSPIDPRLLSRLLLRSRLSARASALIGARAAPLSRPAWRMRARARRRGFARQVPLARDRAGAAACPEPRPPAG
jgi:hypothetical protein